MSSPGVPRAWSFWLLLLFFESESLYVVQAGLELVIFLPWPPECWDYRHARPRLASDHIHPSTFLFVSPLSAKQRAQSLGQVPESVTIYLPLWTFSVVIFSGMSDEIKLE
jgi:hypothetical protein